MLAPVVENPEHISKKASIGFGMVDVKINGIAAIMEAKIQLIETSRNLSLGCIFSSSSLFNLADTFRLIPITSAIIIARRKALTQENSL